MNKFFYFLLSLCVFCSCKKTTFINPSSETLVYPILGGQKTDTIHSDGDWEVKTCPDWLHVEKQDSVLKCVADENNSGAKRDGVIVLEGGNVKQTIAVSQVYICTRLNPETKSLTFEKDGGLKVIKIDTDGYDIKVDVSGNMTTKYEDRMLVVDAPANKGANSTGKITLTCDSQKVEIDVTLKGAFCPRCRGKGVVQCTSCGGSGYNWKENDDMSYGCKRCGGSGSGYPPGYCAECPAYDLKKGTGMMPCPECQGN